MDVPVVGWAVFGAVLLGLLIIDLWAHRGDHGQSMRAAVAWSAVWVAVGLAFAGVVYGYGGVGAAGDYVAAWLMEKSLSVDNLFVFLVVFETLRIPREQQRLVLSWGIFGALVFRALFVVLGVAALQSWGWVRYVFGAVLIFGAWRVWKHDPATDESSRLVDWLRRHLRMTHDTASGRFVVREGGRWVATPLLVALIAVELTDIVFAVDSVPAALAITEDPFIVYSSNAFAILGLRSLYLVLAGVVRAIVYLHYGLAAVLAFAGAKMVLHDWVHVPAWASIVIIAVFIGTSVVASLHSRRKERLAEAIDEDIAPPA